MEFQNQVLQSVMENCLKKLECCNPKTMDLYEETESALEMINSNIDKMFRNARECDALDTRPPAGQPATTQNDHEYDYFISVGFPQKDQVFTKYADKRLHAPNMVNCGTSVPKKYILGKIEYRALTTDEQYNYIVRGINQVKDLITSDNSHYHYFIEQCQSGDLHFHARIDSSLNMKDIKLIFHNAFGISLNHLKFFCVIKKYDVLSWSNYETKTSKTYQATKYKHIKK